MSTATPVALATIGAPERVSENYIRIPVDILAGGETHTGKIVVSYDFLSRVRVESVLDEKIVVDSYKLDPNESENDYAIISSEIDILAQLVAVAGVTLPVLNEDAMSALAVATSYVTSARAVWG